MFQRFLNQATLGLQLTPRGAMMIKSGRDPVDPSQPDMAFIRTHHPDVGETVFLPGTSIKGALRAHAERLLKGIDIKVCDPLERENNPCKNAGKPFRKNPSSAPAVFKKQCPICRTFGSLSTAGRVAILDSFPWPVDADCKGRQECAKEANRTERRTQVSIDRETGQGSQSGALYELEVVTGVSFFTEIYFENVQLWQLGLLIAVLRDLDRGDFALGFGKSRGLGRMRAEIKKLSIESVKLPPNQTKAGDERSLLGAGRLATIEEVRDYGLLTADELSLPAEINQRKTWHGSLLQLEDKAIQLLADLLVDRSLTSAIDQLQAAERHGA